MYFLSKELYSDCNNFWSLLIFHNNNNNTVKFLNFWMPENFAVIYLSFKKRDQISGYFVKKLQME